MNICTGLPLGLLVLAKEDEAIPSYPGKFSTYTALGEKKTQRYARLPGETAKKGKSMDEAFS